MSIFYHPDLFDDIRFQKTEGSDDVFHRIAQAIVPGCFDWGIDGYDIISYRIEEDPYRPIGSLVDTLIERLAVECPANPEQQEILSLLSNLTERGGNLIQQTGGPYLGYVTADEVVRLMRLLEGCSLQNTRSVAEKAALLKILSEAEKRSLGLIYRLA